MMRFVLICLAILTTSFSNAHFSPSHLTSSAIRYKCGRWFVSFNLTLSSKQINDVSSKLIVQTSSRNCTNNDDFVVNQVCEVDLNEKPRLPTPTMADMCHVIAKSDDVYTIGVSRQVDQSDQGHELQILQSVDNWSHRVSSLGQILPDESQFEIIENLTSGSTFQIGEEMIQQIPSSGELGVSICRNRYVPIKFCLGKPFQHSVLTMFSKDHEIKRNGSCVETGYKFDSPHDSTDLIQLKHEETTCQLQQQSLVRMKELISPSCDDSINTVCSPRPGSKAREIVSYPFVGEVMCDTETDGGNWVVFQRRQNSNQDFFLNWDNYTAGFGDLNDNFWLGLDTIDKLCHRSGECELRIDITYKEKKYYATYQNFYLGGPSQNFRLHVGEYSGTAGDVFTSRGNGEEFSTVDRDHDKSNENCANLYHGAWWYDACHKANLNGLWDNDVYAKGLTWYPKTGYYDSVDFVEMKLRIVS